MLDVLDQAQEVLFFIRGSYSIGFEINKQKKFVLKIETISKAIQPKG
jgi:hypothetical protein